MAMTMTQKILAAHAGLKEVRAGQLIEADLDIMLGNDVTTPVAINEFEKAGAAALHDPGKAVFVLDHFTPNKDIKSAEHCKKIRVFAKKHGVQNFFDVGRMGV
jgi:3-isopropylmalate/(R)-2-methylmalate dehydratase large subunit